jgi:hypothetical protein
LPTKEEDRPPELPEMRQKKNQQNQKEECPSPRELYAKAFQWRFKISAQGRLYETLEDESHRHEILN